MPQPHSYVLGSLVVTSFTLDDRHGNPAFPLRVVARRFTPLEAQSSENALTVILAPAVGLVAELYAPMIRELFAFSSDPSCKIRVGSVWAIDLPNHGDAAVLNQEVLEEFHSEMFHGREHVRAIHLVLQSGLISAKESRRLVGVGHCGGAGVMAMLAETHRFEALVFIEPPFFEERGTAPWRRMVEHRRRMARFRQTSWSSQAEAMEYLRQSRPYNEWQPEVLELMDQTSFRATADGKVTTKTQITQELAILASGIDAPRQRDILLSVCRLTPGHIIMGSRRNFWPKELNAVIEETVAMNARDLASIQIIPDAGHFPPQENPLESAKVLLAVLTKSNIAESARAALHSAANAEALRARL